ncbi:MAG: trimethylamine methyltransferase family protein, partial [Armatimonadota bacterium]
MKATETEGVAAGPATWPPVDAIDRVGPGGSFLAGDHTLDHFRSEFWFPKLIDRSRREKWEAQG